MNNKYRITSDTIAIFPMYDSVYQSSILESYQTVIKKEKPLDIIKENCLHYGSSYQGRKASIQHHLDFYQKSPIPIQPTQKLYAFPSQSARSSDCIWLFFHAIKHIERKQQLTAIRFTNGEVVKIATSLHTIQKQYDRTGMIKVLLEQLM
ncbi:competence protein ComK [Gracilibacillus saliphilus]|uniref:competence protein ComK n=1 Tax=Gracilibacillus saliphilus TaxID=543890 RepID=UPI0013D30078|nr:competence protein ComK [Gracilibacillus saliphilus]